MDICTNLTIQNPSITMKNKASGILKRIMSVLTSMAKAKTLALKSKTNALRTRLIVFSLLRNKKIMMSSITQKLHALMGQHDKDQEAESEYLDQSKDLVLHNHNSLSSLPNSTHTELMENVAEDDRDNIIGYDCEEARDDDERYPDLTHSLFESEDLEFEDAGGSVIDMVKNSKQEGEMFSLEDEIDHVADLFIKKFHRQMMLQKQLSMKRRYHDMLQRGPGLAMPDDQRLQRFEGQVKNLSTGQERLLKQTEKIGVGK
ncbi:unnamed protein product [Dovyalis caffra]|uniref:Uncharacterized protein n=1 Tax=Dovyalis caffra TaxID=77055 RepID=A0AAV1SEA6_9ROSI|nr:unnamed protein product [Dovyalis caffra]